MFKTKAKEVMVRNIVVASEEDKLKDVIKEMSNKHISCIIILDELEKAKGILTERDIVRLFSKENKDILNKPIKEFMKSPVITINENTKLTKITRLMKQYNVRRFPVVDESDKVIGLITETDVLEAISDDIKLHQMIQAILLIFGTISMILISLLYYLRRV